MGGGGVGVRVGGKPKVDYTIRAIVYSAKRRKSH